MIKTAKLFLDSNASVINNLRSYYNENCYKFIKPSRKYKIKYNDNWCAMFTSVIAHINGYEGEQFPFEVSVLEQVKLAKVKGTYFTDVKKVKVGDLIVFNWNNDYVPDHVGFVVSVGDYIKTIEGNKSNKVGLRTIKSNSKMIQGFITY